MAKIAFIFSGQGSQKLGMGKDFYDNYEEAREVFQRASKTLDFSMEDLCFNDSKEKLNKTEYTQPALLTVSMAEIQVLKKYGIKADYACGLSLGEYSALVYSQCISFEEAVLLVKKRGKFMQEAVPLGQGSMAAVIGLDDNKIKQCLNKCIKYGKVQIANYNCPNQRVIGGEKKAVEVAVELLKKEGALKVVMLNVSGPFHTELLSKASENLEKELDKIKFEKFNTPVFTNVTGEIVKFENIKETLVKQVKSPVLFEKIIRNMIKHNVDTFIEIGSGKVLSYFVKSIDKKAKVFNIDNIKSLQKTLENIKVEV